MVLAGLPEATWPIPIFLAPMYLQDWRRSLEYRVLALSSVLQSGGKFFLRSAGALGAARDRVSTRPWTPNPRPSRGPLLWNSR